MSLYEEHSLISLNVSFSKIGLQHGHQKKIDNNVEIPLTVSDFKKLGFELCAHTRSLESFPRLPGRGRGGGDAL